MLHIGEALLLFLIFHVIFFCIVLIKTLPALLQDDFAARREHLSSGRKFDLRRKKFLCWIKLRDVAFRDQHVEVLFLLAQIGQFRFDSRRNDGVMRGNLFVIPCAALDAQVCLFNESFKRGIGCCEIFQNRCRITELIFWQVVAIRSRIARELLLIKRLLRIENFLRRVAEDLSRVDLKRGKRIGKTLRRCSLLLLDAFNFCRRHRRGRQDFFCEILLQDASFFIHAILLLRFPLRAKAAVRMTKLYLRREERHWLERADFDFSAHDKTHCRRFYTSYIDDRIVAGASCENRVDARQVHADEPVGAGTSQSGITQSDKFIVRTDVPQCFLHGLDVERVEQDALDGFRLQHADVRKQFVDEELPLAIGIARMDNLVGFLGERRDNLVLLLRVRLDLELPDGRHDRQIFDVPSFIFLVVLVRRILL